MDLYTILQTLNTLEEGYKVVPGIDRERYTDLSDQGLEGPFRLDNGKVVYYDPKAGQYYDRDTDMYLSHEEAGIQEGSMADAEHHKSGAKFGGYWKGTDKNTPKPGMGVGGSCEESVDLDEEIRKEWDKFLAEFGANNPGSTASTTADGSSNPVDQSKTAKELQNTQQNLNKLQGAGVTLPTGISQVSQSSVKAADDPDALPSDEDKNISMSIGQQLQQALAKGDPGQVGQIANALKQIKTGGTQ
jgi:hypothetical protein